MSGIERRHPFRELNLDAVQSLVEPMGRGELVSATPIPRGKVQSNYRVSFRDGGPDCVVRFYADARNCCSKEAALLRKLEGSVPVPKLLHAEPEGSPAWLAAEWVESEPLDAVMERWDEADQIVVAESLADAMAALHRHAFERPGNLDGELRVVPWEFEGDFMEHCRRNTPLEQRLGSELARAFFPFYERWAPLLAEEYTRSVLVHCDMNPTNLLLHRTTAGPRVTALIDWEWACSGTPLMDFGNVLRYRGTPLDSFRDRLAARYLEQGGSLPQDWEAKTLFHDLSSAVEFLSIRQERPESDRRARHQIERTMRWFDQRR